MAEAHATTEGEVDMDAAAALLQGAAPAGAGGEGEADLDGAAALLQGAAPSMDAEVEAQSQQAIALHEEESEELRRMAEAAVQPAPSGDLLAESSAEAAEAAQFEQQLRAVEDQLADVKRNAPVGRQSWGGAQAPERGAVRGRTLPAPPHVYASLTPQPKPAVPAVHLAVVKPDQSGIGRAAKARGSPRRNVQHDVLTPGQRANPTTLTLANPDPDPVPVDSLSLSPNPHLHPHPHPSPHPHPNQVSGRSLVRHAALEPQTRSSPRLADPRQACYAHM